MHLCSYVSKSFLFSSVESLLTTCCSIFSFFYSNHWSLQGESTINAAAAEREGICEENWPIDKAGLTVSWFSHSMNIAQLPRVNECV